MPCAGEPAAAATPALAESSLHSTALLAAHVHAGGAPVAGALEAAGVLQPLTSSGDPRRFQAWLLQGLYHCLAAAEAAHAGRPAMVADANRQSARGVLRLAATSPDAAVRRRAFIALRRLRADVVEDGPAHTVPARPMPAMADA